VVQVSVILLMAGLCYLSLYGHHRATHTLEKAIEGSTFKAGVLAQYDKQIESMDDPQAFLDANEGTIWSMQILGIEWTDPLAAAEPMAVTRRLDNWKLWLSILIPVLATLVLGKVFCSWICPANLLFEIAGKLRHLLRFAEIPPAEVKFSRVNKYVLLVVGLMIATIIGLPIFSLIYPPAAVTRILHGWIFGASIAGGLVLLGLIFAFELFVSPRWWCRTMCPGGALYGLIGWPRLLRVKLATDRCTHCRKCEGACEPGLNPVTESDGIECDNCGACIRRCPEQALRFGVALPAINETKAKHGEPPRAKAATIATILAVAALVPTTAHGHHILGLPHYSYDENYPQVPVLEYETTMGPYSVLLQSYPGKPKPGDQTNLAFHIKNTEAKRSRTEPIKVRVLQTFTFGSNREVLSTTVEPIGEVLYRIYPTFPDEGEYVVELTMDVDGEEQTVGFLMVVGDPSPTTSILVALGCGLGVFLITIRAIKKKRQRRQQQATADNTQGDGVELEPAAAT